MKNEPFLSLIIPCYKQEKTIVENIRRIVSVLDETKYSYEVIIVIDGNVDSSFEILKHEKFNNVSLYQYEQNRGKFYAIRFGMKKAIAKNIMFIDSGLEIDPNGINMLLEHMKWYDADIIVGSKRHPASQVNYTLIRKVLSLGYYYFIKLLLGVKVKDTQAGIKVFRREVLLKVLPRLVEKRFAGDLEMLVVSDYLGYSKIYEAPIKLDYNFSAISSAVTFLSIWMIFIDTLAIFYRINVLHYYDTNHRKTVMPDSVIEYKSRNYN